MRRERAPVAGDNPINSRAEDKLDRAAFVDGLAQTIRSIDPSQGAVIGLFGPWGLGKSSVLNMLKEALNQDPPLVTVTFEPWSFSGARELISLFFAHMSAQLGAKAPDRKVRKIARLFGEYGQTLAVFKWVPAAGTWLDRLGSVAGFLANVQQKRSDKAAQLNNQREELTRLLRDRTQPIVVVIDEIDRLLPSEVRDIFTLVRLTAKFPNLIYVLAFDRAKVETMLNEPGFGARGYLEKIVELPLDLPAVSRHALDTILADELGALRNRMPTGPFHLDQWEQVYPAVLRPLFDDLRDVNRFLLALPAALVTVGREVAFVDAVALEALRLLQPEAFTQLAIHAELLTALTSPGQADPAGQLESIAAAVPEQQPEARKAVRALCYLLFPATEQYHGGVHYSAHEARQWRAQHKVASRPVLDIYLGRALGPQTAPSDLMDRVYESLTDPSNLRRLLEALPADQLDDVLIRLEAAEPDLKPVQAEPVITVLAGLYPRLAQMAAPTHVRSLRISPVRSADRAIAHMLVRIEDDKSRLVAVRNTVEALPSLYARMRLLYAATQRTRMRATLIPEPEADILRRDLWNLVRHCTVDQLASEPRILTLLLKALDDDPHDRITISEHLREPDMMAALLRDPGFRTAITDYGGQPLLRIFAGSDDLRSCIDRFGKLADPDVLHDPQVNRVLDLARTFLTNEPPLPEWARRPIELATTSCAPRNLFEPRDESAHLVLRTVALCQTSPQRSQSAWLNTGGFRDALADFLRDSDIVTSCADYCTRHGLHAASSDSALDEPTDLAPRYVVLRRTLTAPDSRAVITARVGVSLPAAADPLVRVFSELWVAPSPDGEQPGGPLLSLAETRDLLCALLATTNAIAEDYLPAYLGEPTLPHEASEIHIACPTRSNSLGQQGKADIANVIDLTPLGERSERTPPRDGEYRAGAHYLIDSAADRTNLVNHALLSMAGPFWAYLHPDRPLAELLQSGTQSMLERWLD